MGRSKYVSSLLALALGVALIVTSACTPTPPTGTLMKSGGAALPPAGCIELRKREGKDAC